MTMSYSSFFSSGLMGSQRSRPSSPGVSRPDSPMIIPSTPYRESVDIEEDTTPGAMGGHLDKCERPKLRKRRSSLTVAASPLQQIKSNTRNSTHAMQKQHAISRSRSGSINEFATEANSLVGRMRSGSVGTALRSRRVIRKPSGPPPTMPLPPLPMHSCCAPTVPNSIPTTPLRRPLMMRATTTENYDRAMASSPVTYEFSALHAKHVAMTCVDSDELMKEN